MVLSYYKAVGPEWHRLNDGQVVIPDEPGVTEPSEPTNFVAIADYDNGAISVTWGPPADDGGSPVTGYTLTMTPPVGADVVIGTTTLGHDFTGLTDVGVYGFSVTAENIIGTGPPADTSAYFDAQGVAHGRDLNDTNTGVERFGLTLTPMAGTTINIDGTVIEEMKINSTLTVRARNVIIRKCHLDAQGADYALRTDFSGNYSVTLEDCTISDASNIGAMGVGLTLIRCQVIRCSDGLRPYGSAVGNGSTFTETWVHTLHRDQVDAHSDCFQWTTSSGGTTRDTLIERCKFDALGDDPLGGPDDYHNAAIQTANPGTTTLINCRVNDSYFNGGNYTLNGSTTGSDVVYRNNRFGLNFRYGPVAGASAPKFDASNVWDVTGVTDEGDPVTADTPVLP